MHDRTLRQDRSGESAATSIGGAATSRGINFPGLYDLLLRIMTRGRDPAYRADLLDRAGIGPGHHVLDIGCGTGTQAIAACARVQPGGLVVGIDVSPNMLAAARHKARRAGLDIEFRQADAAELPFDNERFDVVTLTTVMHMLPENRRRLSLREASRVLRRGGRLLLVDYAGNVSERTGLIARHGAHGRFDLHDLRDALSAEGFAGIDGGPLDWLSLHFLRGTKK
jgi:SAM-dependent methyltransferase